MSGIVNQVQHEGRQVAVDREVREAAEVVFRHLGKHLHVFSDRGVEPQLELSVPFGHAPYVVQIVPVGALNVPMNGPDPLGCRAEGSTPVEAALRCAAKVEELDELARRVEAERSGPADLVAVVREHLGQSLLVIVQGPMQEHAR